MGTKKKTSKQKAFDLMLQYADDQCELTKRIRTDDIELVRYFKDKLNWWTIAQRNTLTDEFIDEFYEYLKPHFGKIEVNTNIDREFLRRNRDYINWCEFVYQNNGNRFSVDFLKEFEEELKNYYPTITSKKGLPKESIEYLLEHTGEVFNSLSTNPTISMKKLKEYADKLNWNDVSHHARCLDSAKNFEYFKDRINFNRFTSRSYYYRRKNTRNRFVISEYFLSNYMNEDINWEDFFDISDYSLKYDLKNHLNEKDYFPEPVNLKFFKENYNKLPAKAKKAYNDFKTGKRNHNSGYYYSNYVIPWE